MTALDLEIAAAEERLQARRAAWKTHLGSVHQRLRDAAISPTALLSAVAVGYCADRLRSSPVARAPAAPHPGGRGVQPVVLLVNALNIAGALLALGARSGGVAPGMRPDERPDA